MRTITVLALLTALLAGGVTITSPAASAAQPQTEAANAAVQYIESLQNADGGFPAFGSESTPGSTIDAVFALVAAGVDPNTVTNGGNSPLDYLATQVSEYIQDPGAAAKLALALLVIHGDPTSFGGVNVYGPMGEALDLETGAYGVDLFDQSLFILGAVQLLGVGAGPPVPVTAGYLRSVQVSDGGWEFAAGQGSDSNTTALALQALTGAGDAPGSPAIANGIAYLRTVQNADGGLAFATGSESDPNSTALAIQALVAAGQDIDAGGPWDRGGRTPMDALLLFRNAATGAFQYGGEDSPFATYQAVPALMLAPFPDLETRVVAGPTPVAPTAVTVTPPATPAPVLPGAGAAPRHDDGFWWPVTALAVVGAAVVAAGAVAWRAR